MGPNRIHPEVLSILTCSGSSSPPSSPWRSQMRVSKALTSISLVKYQQKVKTTIKVKINKCFRHRYWRWLWVRFNTYVLSGFCYFYYLKNTFLTWAFNNFLRPCLSQSRPLKCMHTRLLTLYSLIAHFHIAPVTAANSFLLSWRERSETSVSRAPKSYTAFLVCSFTAHCQVIGKKTLRGL